MTAESPYLGGEGWAPPRSFRLYAPSPPAEWPVGTSASTLETLRVGIATAPPESLFHHVVRVRARFPDERVLPEHDFAQWVRGALRLPSVAERLAAAGAGASRSIEEIRTALLHALAPPSEEERDRRAPQGSDFHFLASRCEAHPLDLEAVDPDMLVELWPRLRLGAVFYHLFEAPLLGPNDRSVLGWLREHDAYVLADIADGLIAGAKPLPKLHSEIGARWRRALIGRRLVRRAGASEEQRRREAQDVIRRLAERLRSGGQGSESA